MTTTPTPYDTGYFTDDLNVSDTRSQDTLQLSSANDAANVIETFRASGATSMWTSLDRSQVADQLEDLVRNPRNIYQGSLNLCGPAAFFNIVTGRHPVAVAQAATALFDTGAADLGGLHIQPSTDLTAASYADLAARMTNGVTPQAQWMLLGALRNTTNVFWQPTWRGDPNQELAGMTRPEELAGWLRSTGYFSNVTDGGKWASSPGIPNAQNLPTSQGYDNALLLNTNLLAAALVADSSNVPQGQAPNLNPAGIDSSDHSFLLSQFPNHWVTLISPVTSSVYADANGQNYITMSIWTWGKPYLSLWIPQGAFLDNYYGAVTTSVPVSN